MFRKIFHPRFITFFSKLISFNVCIEIRGGCGKMERGYTNISYLIFIQSISIFLDRFIKRIQTNKQSDCTS